MRRPPWNRRGAVDPHSVLHNSRAVRNITIKVAEEVAQWARVHAAKNGTSISRIVSEMLRAGLGLGRRGGQQLVQRVVGETA